MKAEYREEICDGCDQRFSIDEPLYEIKTDHQHLIIFKNRYFGRVLALDGVIQTTEADEFIYHEMMAHVPLMAHGRVHRVLIIGGGDGGLLREVLHHRDIRRVVQVEIDASVIDLCRRYLPNHSQGAFDDSRATVVIDDGMHFLEHTDKRFDVILTDSTDPEGPAEVLFSRRYYAACQRCLAPGGILVTQNGVAFLQLDEVRASAGHFNHLFRDWHFFGASVPTYVGGIMTFGWASDDPRPRQTDPQTLQERFTHSGIVTRYYTPQLHGAAFALPQYILDAIGKTSA
ncbi:polyamine aminopropyltransferase [Desulfosarcina ovata subsp. sediminis]|uniref:Polyamine aminopropyltransferase n=1 Tax=Desulfosarcina ovata subsp. sediminis TaxID=885957 RepID=A0A5K7ZG93_9BACT|nr:polyamine aminopropyltransferase [Desulfosarcina ovata]BBO80354.1 polyamine aminopropyltransferase [Desulfosarcina ovata subsp. sediminis]